jgi:hypothetical protein
LSSDHLQAKSTVFELNLPRPFACWRNTTIFLLVVLHVEYSVKETPRAKYRPQTYSGLSSFFTPIGGAQRINLLSQDKPHLGTHRRNRKIIDVAENDVCLDNGMHFRYFDDTACCFVSSFKTTNETAISCTYKLPRSSSSLQRFLFRPASESNGPPPNTVIASLDACPEDMSLEEYKALCSMSFGVEIQWENILRQLAMPSVVFKKMETCIFILQIINQAGPASDSILRMGHAILDDNDFAAALLAEIKQAAARIEENWESAQELNALIFLTQRVLSLSSSTEIQAQCLSHLTYLRAIAFRWVTLVRVKATSATSDKHRTDLIVRSAHIALICVGSFDSEGSVLCQILETASEASIFIQCCMVIHDRKGLLDLTSDCLLPILYYRWGILCYRCYHILANNVVYRQTAALDQAIERTWAAYRMGSPWFCEPVGCDYWLVTQMTSEASSDGGLRVHYNLLTGELLINGRPLARLPSEYERHDTYKTLFGQSLVEVMPSDIPGMQFSGQREHMGQTIHLGKRLIPGSRDFDLCVRAVNKHSTWEFVPPRLLAGAFPDAFVEDYAHWYSLDRGCLEFRPVKEPWELSDSHWQLQRRHPQRSWCLLKNGISLVTAKSNTAKAISGILEPIERASKVHCILHNESSVLEIEIPSPTRFQSSIRTMFHPIPPILWDVD